MPSPRAVLADLKNLKLDTKKAWSAVGVNGHLKGGHSHAATTKKAEAVVVAEEAEIKEAVQAVVSVPAVEQEALLAHEEVFAAEPEVQQSAETVEEGQDAGLDLENDFFRSKKKKKLTA